MTQLMLSMRNSSVWNHKSVIVNRIYLTLLGTSCVIAVFGIYLAVRSVYDFAQDRSVLEAELKIQKEKVSEFEKKSSVTDVIEKPNPTQRQGQIPKFDPTKPYDVVDPNSGRSYPSDVFAAMKKEICLSALLDEDPENNDKNCPSWMREELYPKVRGGLYNCGRYDYSQLIFSALFFCPLIILALSRMWILWVFVDKNKSG